MALVGISQVDTTGANPAYASASACGRSNEIMRRRLQINAFNSCTDQVGCSCCSSAIVPETCGVAEDVPLKFATAAASANR